MVVVVAVGFDVVVGRGEVVAVGPEVAVVDGPAAMVVVNSADASPVDEVSSPGTTAVATVVVVAEISVVRPACSVRFDPCEDALVIPTDKTATKLRICAQRGKFRNRFQRLMSDGTGQA